MQGWILRRARRIAHGWSHGSVLCPIKFGTLLIDSQSHRASTRENELPRIVFHLIGFQKLTVDTGSCRTLIARRRSRCADPAVPIVLCRSCCADRAVLIVLC